MPESDSMSRYVANWLRAAQTGDAAWFAANLADDFVYVNQIGGLSTKADLITANVRHQNRYELREVEARIYERVHVGVGRYFAQGVIPRSVPVTDELRDRYAAGCQLRFTVVCRDSAEGEMCVGLQTTVIDEVV